MTVYNTRGAGHRDRRRDYDVMFNRAYAWNPKFDELSSELLSGTHKLRYASHLRERIESRYPNRDFELEDINFTSIRQAKVVEMECERKTINGELTFLIRKMVMRLPPRKGDREVICCVLDFGKDGEMFVKTAYLNHGHDNHQIGMDSTEFSRRTEGKFGYWGSGRFAPVVYDCREPEAQKKEEKPVQTGKEKIINLTGYDALRSQKEEGVTDPKDQDEVNRLQRFTQMPQAYEITSRAQALADIARKEGADKALISASHAPYLIRPLEDALKEAGIRPVYAYVEKIRERSRFSDGSKGVEEHLRHKVFIEPEDAKEKPRKAVVLNNKVLNLTFHDTMFEEKQDGVIEPRTKIDVRSLLAFNDTPTQEDVKERVEHLADIAAASHCSRALIGGAPFLLAPLERRLRDMGIEPVYSYARKENIEVMDWDGNISLMRQYRHVGLVNNLEEKERNQNIERQNVKKVLEKCRSVSADTKPGKENPEKGRQPEL